MKEEERAFSWGEGAVEGKESILLTPFGTPSALFCWSLVLMEGRVKSESGVAAIQADRQSWRHSHCPTVPCASSHRDDEKYSHQHEIRRVCCSWKYLLQEEVTALFLKTYVCVNHHLGWEEVPKFSSHY